MSDDLSLMQCNSKYSLEFHITDHNIILTYSQVTECAQILQDENATEKEDGFHDNDSVVQETALDSLTCWINVKQLSHDAPGLILDVLLRCKRFDTANKWADLHHVTDKLRMVWMKSTYL